MTQQNGLWAFDVRSLRLAPERYEYKFVVNGQWEAGANRALAIGEQGWLERPPSAVLDARIEDACRVAVYLQKPVSSASNLAVRLVPDVPIREVKLLDGPVLAIDTVAPLALSNRYTVVISNLAPRVIRQPVRPGAALNRMRPDGPLGVTRDRASDAAAVSVFAPRAAWMTLCVADTPERVMRRSGFNRTDVPMRMNPADGTWAATWARASTACYYGFRLDGPAGPGESFDRDTVAGDPYARAVVNENGPCIVIDPEATNAWFGGWTDGAFQAPALQDMVIYETHVRDLTADPSSGVPAALRGTFEGVVASRGTGTGLDHLKALGVNMIEFMPVQEFDNGTNAPGWGYSPDFFFAPESSYGRAPAAGSQYHEFKRLVNELHRQGFGVILDVVYNHVGGANPFGRLDRRVYFRLDAEDGYSNFSGCGNDLKTESPAVRRLIVDNVLYWMNEHHVDGFRFDLAELVDMETLMAVEAAARKANPNVVLISEPWSCRGDHKRALRGTSWAAWNNEFTHPVRSFIRGQGRSDEVPKAIAGSVDLWTASPLQSVNYFESHDDMTLADELASSPGRDARLLNMGDVARNRLAATVLFTSLGIPMLAEGQEFLRSKHGIRNTFAAGDAVNAIRWTDRERPMAREALAHYQGMVRLRRSPEGASLRLAAAPPPAYYDWITPGSGQLLGYRINVRHERPGRAFVVLVNASGRDEPFEVEFSTGPWRLVSDGQVVDLTGRRVKPMSVAGGARNRVTVPALTAYVFMDGP
jgi:pullulanase/glycogen debranching enzyme